MVRMLASLALVASVALASPARAAGDPESGKQVYNKCKACHLIGGGKNTIGPNLSGIYGRKAGTVDGFKYSPAMEKSGVVWNDDALRKYLTDPKSLVPNGKMVFAGLRSDQELDDVIAYLKEAK